MSKMGLHDPFGHLQHNLWQKERPGVTLAILLPTTKSRESTPPRACRWNATHHWKKSQCRLQLCFRPHPDRRFEQGVIVPQSWGSPNLGSFETSPWESQDKKPFGCTCRGEAHKILYGGRWWFPPNPGRGESCEFEVIRGSS